jgi:hypothetical protein
MKNMTNRRIFGLGSFAQGRGMSIFLDEKDYRLVRIDDKFRIDKLY